jgi:VCBS repeat-containing protein
MLMTKFYASYKPLCFLALAIFFAPTALFSQIPPTAVWDYVFTDDNVSATGSLAENDLNPSNSLLTYTLLTNTSLGELILQTNGDWSFVPILGIAGENETIFYQVCDHLNQCSSDSIVVVVRFQNNVPIPVDDYLFVEINEPRFGDASINDIEPDSLSDPISGINAFALTTDPLHGEVIFNLDGTFQYTPDPGYTGPDEFEYINCDPCGTCAFGDVFITVVGSNEEPIGGNSPVYTLNEDSSYSNTALPLVTDPENDALTFFTASLPSHGTISISSNGTYTYTPDENYFGSDSFIYVACDIVGQCTVGFIYFEVLNLPDALDVTSENLTTTEDIPSFTGNVALNDTSENGPIIYTVLQGPNQGSINLQTNGNFSFTPATNYSGQVLVLIQACDATPTCATDSLRITITPINDMPVASADYQFGYEDTPITGNVSTNDSDPDGDLLTYSLLNAPENGNVTLQPNGQYTYTGYQNFSGYDTLTYKVCDPSLECSFATLEIEVIEINDDPIIVADHFVGNEDDAVSGNIRLNDTEPDGEIIFYFTVSDPAHGVLEIDQDGVFTYTPEANWFGSDSIAYFGCDPCSVCFQSYLKITINPENDTPSAAPATISTDEDFPVSGTLASLANDIENSALSFSITNNALHGTFALQSNGNYTYTPSDNYFGPDQITYSVCDTQNACSSAIINITINPMNDAPVAADDEDVTNEDEILNGNVANDTDSDDITLLYSVITQPMHGAVLMNNDGTYSFEPESNYNGVDMFTYSVCDDENSCDAGVVILDINPINDTPVVLHDSNVAYDNISINGSVALNDSDFDGDILEFLLLTTAQNGIFNLEQNGTYTYTPNTNFAGTEIIEYNACDPSNACATATLTITVSSTNTLPNAADIILPNSDEDMILTGSLNELVTDSEGGALTFSIFLQPANGTLQLNVTGSYTYTPDENYFGPDSYMYQVCDSGNLCDEGQVNINILSLNDSPVAVGEEFNMNEDTILSGSVSENDSDAEMEVLTFSTSSVAENGEFILTPSGEFTFTPNGNYYGTVNIEYSVCDENSACSEANLIIHVLALNDAPEAMNDSFSTDEDEILFGDVSTNDSDLETEDLSFSILTPAMHGVVMLNLNGTFTYIPNANYAGNDAFSYLACDEESLCSEATVIIAMLSINDQPIANDDSQTITEDNIANGTIASNDTDADGDDLTYSSVFGAMNGTLVLQNDGTYSYTPNINFFGTEMISYTVCDPSNVCSEAMLYIMITAVNDLPLTENETYSMYEDMSLNGAVNTNDSDAESSLLEYSILVGPSHGMLNMTTNGTFEYTPETNFNGTENIVYLVCDDDNGCSEASLEITIAPVNDIPDVLGEYVHVLEDTWQEGDLSANDLDIDGDQLSYSVVTNSTQGEFILNTNGTYIYTPTPDFSGMDSVAYSVCDIENVCIQTKIIFEVDFMNDNPIAVDEFIELEMNTLVSGSLLDNEIEPDGEVLHYFVLEDNSNGNFDLLDDGTYTYLPNDGVTGVFTVTYYACDPCAICDEGMITFYVVQPGEVNTAPIALNTSSTVCRNGLATIAMNDFVNDIQTSDSQLIIQIDTPSEGNIVYDPSTHTLQYTPSSSGSNFVSLEYTVCDVSLVSLCSSASISFDITENTSPQVGNALVTHVNCFNSSTGSIDLSDITGGDNFSFLWSNDAEVADISNLSADEYFVTVTSDAACSIPATYSYLIEQPEAALGAAIGMVNNISDNQNGSIELMISGGTEPYEVAWTGPDDFSSTNEDIDGLLLDGNYSALITDAHGCQSATTTMITGLEEIESSRLRVMPNPFHETFQLYCNSALKNQVRIEIYDAAGKLITTQSNVNFKNNMTTIDMHAFAAGCYQLKITSGDFVKSVALIKE